MAALSAQCLDLLSTRHVCICASLCCVDVHVHMPFVSHASVFCRVAFSNSLYFMSVLQILLFKSF